MSLNATNPLIVEAEPIDTESVGNLASLMLPELPGCSDLMVRQQLQRTLGEFCKETGACVVHFLAEAAEGVFEYAVGAVPCNMMIDALQGVTRNGDDLFENAHYSIRGDGRVTSVRFASGVLSKGDRLDFSYSVFPKLGCDDCPSWFKERYGQAIVDGTMYNLLKMKNRPWSDEGRAADYAVRYEKERGEASYRRMLGSPVSNGGVGSVAPKGGLFI